VLLAAASCAHVKTSVGESSMKKDSCSCATLTTRGPSCADESLDHSASDNMSHQSGFHSSSHITMPSEPPIRVLCTCISFGRREKFYLDILDQRRPGQLIPRSTQTYHCQKDWQIPSVPSDVVCMFLFSTPLRY
jgi:hypothetical protein